MSATTKKRGLQSVPRTRRQRADNPDLVQDHPLAAEVLRDEQARVVPLGRLRPDPRQPRKSFDEHSIRELAESIREQGLIAPLGVIEDGDYYTVVHGGRRLRALQLLGVQDVPVRLVRPDKVREIQLTENLQREDLPLLEEAQALAELKQELKASVKVLAEKINKSVGYVQRRLEILTWPEDVQEFLRAYPGFLTAAATIARIKDPSRRAQRIQALLAEDAPEEGKARSVGRPPKAFRFALRKNGSFDLHVKFRPGAADREELIAQLREALRRLEEAD